MRPTPPVGATSARRRRTTPARFPDGCQGLHPGHEHPISPLRRHVREKAAVMNHPAVIVPLVFFSIALAFCGVSFLLAFISGWRSLATRGPARPGVDGEEIPLGFGMMVGLVSYRSCVVVETTPEALLLTQFPLFVGHPPMALPWSAIEMRPGWGTLFFG